MLLQKMNKVCILQSCIFINIVLILVLCSSFFIFNNQESSYFTWGWSDTFTFVSISINTPLKYIILCFFIMFFNISEILLNDIGYPLIHFSTYNPYQKNIDDLSRKDLELYSNIIFFIQTFKKLSQVLITLSQMDIAVISLLSYQVSAYFAISYLLDNKEFNSASSLQPQTKYKYESINEKNPLINA
jgi:hypothetical protein